MNILNNKKIKSLPINKYFEVVHPEYLYYKIIPLKSLRNYNSDKIINAIATIYKTITQRIIKDNKKYFFNTQVKISYYIYMEKDKAEFYFIIPKQYKTLLYDKINDTWKGITIENVENIPSFDKNKIQYGLTYKKQDAFSLCTDKRNNALLSALMSTMYVMEENDKVGVIFNFIPTGQIGWRADYDYTMRKFKEGFPVEREKKSAKYMSKLILKLLLSIIDTVLGGVTDAVGNKNIKSQPIYIQQYNTELLPETKHKRDSRIINTQIAILSQSEDKNRIINNAVSTCEAFKSISGDNELIYRRFNKDLNISDCILKGVDKIKTTALESQNFISLPAKELIEEHKIKCIDVFESETPKELTNGVINIGKSTFRGATNNVYLCNDPELRNLALCITGSNRSGKTTLLSNIINDCLNNGECVVLPDFCGNCELSEHIAKLFPDKVLNIDCADFDNLQGMGYNEINSNEPNEFKAYRNAKMQSIQLMTLVNGINDDDRTLKAKMDRYLEAASLTVFISGGSIKDVFSVLQSYKARKYFIDKIPQNQLSNLSEYVDSLNELDKRSRDGEVTETRFDNIVGIIDRLTTLKKNAYVELMLKKDCSNNINLFNEIQKSQIICIKMPEHMFSTPIEKDIFTTYWFSKLWLSLQLRKNEIERDKHIKVNIIVDELYQVEKCQALIASKLSQMPKFTAKMIVTCHYLGQIPILRAELKASNASYMILQGSNVNNFNDLKTEFFNLGYTVDDLLGLKRFQSLNLISCEIGYWAGITQLPPPKKKFTT